MENAHLQISDIPPKVKLSSISAGNKHFPKVLHVESNKMQESNTKNLPYYGVIMSSNTQADGEL